MKKGNMKLTAICVAAGLILSQGCLSVYAAGAETVLAGLGEFAAPVISETEAVPESTADVTSEEAVPEETAEEQTVIEETAAENTAEAEATEEETIETEEEIPFVPDVDAKGTTGFALCEEYLNVRASAEKEGDLVGKVYNYGALEILDVDENGWYKVRSGNVEGYVAGQYVATGDLAEEIAADAGYTTAEVGAEVLNLRADATTDADVIGHVTSDHEVEVVEDQGEWIKVLVDGMYGYVSSDYVYTSTEYATAETLEEEQQRLDEQWLAYLAEQEAAAAAYAQSVAYTEPVYTNQVYSEPVYAEQYYTEPVYTEQYYADVYTEAYDDSTYYALQEEADAAASTSYDAQVQAQEQYQAYVDAQNAADEAVWNGGDEQSVYDTAAAAQEAYEQYVIAQEQADAAAQAEADALAAAQAEADALAAAQAEAEALAAAQAEAAYYQTEEYGYQETYEDTSAQDYYEDTSYTETYDDTSYTETYEDTSYSAPSSTGQAVADFATQYVGGPYVYGGSSLTGGADCSGFVMSVYSNFGISLPHNAAAQSGYGTSVSMDNLQPGDLLFYDGGGGIGHVSIYIGGGQVVHASNPTNGIIISDIGYRTPCAATRLV